MRNRGKILICALTAALFAVGSVIAVADGYAFWSPHSGAVYFNQASNREYYSSGYLEPEESTNYQDTKVVRVISKSASIWQEARTNSKKLGSATNGQEIEIIRGEHGGPIEQDGFYRVSFNNKAGWINGNTSDSTCDAGIIVEGGEAYLMVIMTSAPDSEGNRQLVSDLAGALWAARDTLQPAGLVKA